MADYRWRTHQQSLCTASSMQTDVVDFDGAVGWTDSNGNGSHYFGIRFYNADSGTLGQTVHTDMTASWSVSYDKNNRATWTITHRVNSIWADRWRGGSSGIYNRRYIIRDRQGGSEKSNIYYSINQTGTLRGAFEFQTVLRADPGQDTSLASFYGANWSDYNHTGEGDCSIYIDKFTAGIQFHNNRAWEYDTPEIKNKTCQGNSTGLRLSATVDFGEIRPGTKNWVEYQVSKSPMFDNIAWSGSKTGNNDRNQTLSIDMVGLQPNTKYYVRYRASNNSKTSAWTTCEAVTLTTNRLSEAKSGYWSEGEVTLAIQMGDGYYPDPTTKIYIRKCGTSNWTEKMTRATKTVAHLTLTGLEAETCYEVQARTTTPAGTYSGNIVSFTTPVKNVATAKFTKIDPEVDADTLETYADMCYHYISTNSPTYITVYYRVKGGFDSTWLKAEETVEFTDLEGDYCFTLHDLFPNQTVYETYIHTETDGNPWDSQISEFTTPLLPLPENCNCDNFNYLVDLICQAVKPLYNGNKTIYANPATKELCDPYSENPTLATLWSRILRFDSAAACLMCDMLELIKLKNGNYDQYYVGDTGWTQVAYEIVQENELLASSGAVADYIAEKMHEVWHYHSDIDYLVGTLAEAPTTGLTVGTDIIVTSESKRYVWTGTAWREDTDFEVDNFAVFHVNYASDTSFGKVKAGHAYYYFEGTWNNLDADTRELEARCKVLEDAKLVFPQSTTEDLMTIQTNNENFNYNSLPTAERVICFVVEDTDLPPKGSFRITYETGDNATIVPDEDVLSGATAQRPADPERTGYIFNHWEDKNVPGTTFNFSTPILKNYDLIAIWDPLPVTVTFDIRTELGTEGTAPADVAAYYGDPVPLPDDSTFHLPGGTFAGWMRNGVPMSSADVLMGDTTLVAFYTMDEFDVTIHPENGQPNIVKHIVAGTGVEQPDDPIRQDYVFVGWYTDPVGGEQITDWSATFYGPTDIYAHWVPAQYTITFVPGGGNSNFTQTVNYMDTVTQPAAPIWRL